MARRVGNRKRWHTNLWSTLTLIILLPAIVTSGGYDDLGGSSSASSGASGGSSGGSSDGGVDISDYASNNGQIPNHLVCKFKWLFKIFISSIYD